MATLSQAKTLGGIGSLLMILTVVPAAGAILGIVGFILVLFAVKNISDAVGDSSIFTNMIIAVVLGIGGVVVGAVVLFASFLSVVGLGAFAQGPFVPEAIATGGIVELIVGLILGLAVIWILLIVSAFFLRKSYNSIGAKLSVGMFGTAALLYLIGAILTIILVGFVLIFIAGILQIIAFFSVPDQLPQSAAPQMQSAPMTPTS